MYGMNNLQMGRKSKIPVSTRMRTKVFNELKKYEYKNLHIINQVVNSVYNKKVAFTTKGLKVNKRRNMLTV